MNKREIFDKVKAHLLAQDAKALDPVSGECMYRTSDGKTCAVGCLITDEAYNDCFENFTMSHGRVHRALHESGIEVDEDLEDMLRELQVIHDRCPVEDWTRALNDLENHTTF